MSLDMKDSCATCRFHRKEARARVEREVFDSIVELADEDDKVFICGLTQKEIGLDPILCDSFQASKTVAAGALDVVVDRSLARLEERARREREDSR